MTWFDPFPFKKRPEEYFKPINLMAVDNLWIILLITMTILT